MQIIAPDSAGPIKTRKKESRALLLALEVVRDSLLTNPGMYYSELERSVETSAKCSGSTAQRAIKLHYGDGSLTTKRDGNKKRYYWDDAPRTIQSDRLLPVNRSVVSASSAPKVGGIRRNPTEWMLVMLMGAT